MKNDTNQNINKAIEWLREKVEQSNTKGLVVGISGGIDSAVCAALARKAFPEDSIGIIIPCGSVESDLEDAVKVVNSVGIKSFRIDLTTIQKNLYDKIAADILYKEECARVAGANLKARLRMSVLYTYANLMNYLVVGTDNAAEAYTGYFTKYGDGGVDILPIAGLKKRDVREWAQALSIPQEIISKPPSAGLWFGQTDESEMGTTYEMIDDYLEGKEIPLKDRLIIDELHRKSQHKRELPPSFMF